MINCPMQVSVICTAKNAATTIERTIASILAQDMNDWEMIVVDDGSADDTATIVSCFARRDPRIKLIRTDGIGRMPALNLALAETKASLVANIDADDESHPERLRLQLECLQRHPEFVLIGSEYILIKDDQQPYWPLRNNDLTTLTVVDVTNQLALCNPLCHSSVMMRRSAVLDLGGYSHPLCDDYDLWVRLAEAGHLIGKLKYPLAAYRVHAKQFFLRSPRLRYLIEIAKIQARAIRAQGAGKHYWALLALRVLWGFLPLGVRLRRHGGFPHTDRA
jgi:teichuronic acid biosynthesis glycosyltransferase TuaG